MHGERGCVSQKKPTENPPKLFKKKRNAWPLTKAVKLPCPVSSLACFSRRLERFPFPPIDSNAVVTFGGRRPRCATLSGCVRSDTHCRFERRGYVSNMSVVACCRRLPSLRSLQTAKAARPSSLNSPTSGMPVHILRSPQAGPFLTRYLRLSLPHAPRTVTDSTLHVYAADPSEPSASLSDNVAFGARRPPTLSFAEQHRARPWQYPRVECSDPRRPPRRTLHNQRARAPGQSALVTPPGRQRSQQYSKRGIGSAPIRECGTPPPIRFLPSAARCRVACAVGLARHMPLGRCALPQMWTRPSSSKPCRLRWTIIVRHTPPMAHEHCSS